MRQLRIPHRAADLPPRLQIRLHLVDLLRDQPVRIGAQRNPYRDPPSAAHDLADAARHAVRRRERRVPRRVRHEIQHRAGRAARVRGVPRLHRLQRRRRVVGAHAAGLHVHHVDPPRGQELLGHARGEPFERELGRVVVRAAGRRQHAAHAADVDDDAAALPARGAVDVAQDRQRALGHVDDAPEVGVEERARARVAGGRGLRVAHQRVPRVVDDDVDAPEARQRRGEGRVDGRRRRDVQRQLQHVGRVGDRGRAEGRGVARRGDDALRWVFLDEVLHERLPDAGGAAGDFV